MDRLPDRPMDPSSKTMVIKGVLTGVNRWSAEGTGCSPWIMAAIVFAAAFLTFSGVLGYGLVWDDLPLIQQVESALSEGETARLFTGSFHVKVEQSARYYRPVMMASLLLDMAISDGVPWFSHLVNIFLHALNALLVLLLFRRILGNETGAVAGALLFAVHPVHTEAVTVVSSRMDLLALLLLLPPALHYAVPRPYREQHGLPVRLLVLFSFFLACLTKETAFMFPLVLFTLIILLEKRPWKKELIRICPVFIVAAVAFMARVAVFAGESAGGGSNGIRAGEMFPSISIPNMLKILMVNMRMAVHPFPERFHWFSGDIFLEWTTILAAMFFLVFLVWVFRRNPGSAIRGIVWWSLFVLPVLGLFNLGQSLAAERYAYIPSVGICLMAGGLVASLQHPFFQRKYARGMAWAVVLVLMVTAALHARNWKDEVTLFTKVVETNPSFADGYINLGVALAGEDRHDEALEAYGKAEVLAPGETVAVFNKGNLLFSIGRYEEALANFDAVLGRQPDDWEAALNRGNVLAVLGRTQEAARSYEMALKNSENSGKPLVGLAVLSAREGKYEEAVRIFKEAASREPTLTEAYEGMGEAYAAMGKTGRAERAFLRAVRLSPENTRAAVMLGELLMNTGRPGKAIQAFRTALASDPSFTRAWAGFIRASEAAGKGREAERAISEMERRNPILAREIRRALSGSPP